MNMDLLMYNKPTNASTASARTTGGKRVSTSALRRPATVCTRFWTESDLSARLPLCACSIPQLSSPRSQSLLVPRSGALDCASLSAAAMTRDERKSNAAQDDVHMAAAGDVSMSDAMPAAAKLESTDAAATAAMHSKAAATAAASSDAMDDEREESKMGDATQIAATQAASSSAAAAAPVPSAGTSPSKKKGECTAHAGSRQRRKRLHSVGWRAIH